MIDRSASRGRRPRLAAWMGGTSPKRAHLWMLALLLATILVVFLQTFASMLSTWLHSETYLHGILIFPISAYLVWQKRLELRRLIPFAYWPGAAMLLALSLLWWIADTLGIQVVRQLAVTSMIGLAVITIMGPQLTRRIAFPLGYLFFAVPIGEALVPYLIDYTAAFTVKALNVTGIPVFRDGRYFSTPAGNFEVARACSGIRYLLAALTLGTLFAYVIFRSGRKRMLFVLFSIVVPIVANGLRAYGIVLLAQYVSLEFATGVDHIIFGWVFFGIVIFLMFAVGSAFSDRDTEEIKSPAPTAPVQSGDRRTVAAPIGLFAATVACVAVGPLLAELNARQASTARLAIVGLPAGVPGWTGSTIASPVSPPEFYGAADEAIAQYRRGDSKLDAAVVQYAGGQRQGRELASSENSIVDGDEWRIGNTETRLVKLADGSAVKINEAVVRSRVARRIVWHWYDIDGIHASSNFEAKLLEAKGVMLGSRSRSTAVILATDLSGDIEAHRALLREFVRKAYEPLRACIEGRESERCTLRSDRPGAE